MTLRACMPERACYVPVGTPASVCLPLYIGRHAGTLYGRDLVRGVPDGTANSRSDEYTWGGSKT